MAIRAHYKGDGSEFLESVPARHLDEDEYDALSADQKQAVRGSGLYDVKTEKELHPQKAAEPAPARKDGD